MSDQERPPSEWALKRAAGKARRARLIERREAYFNLLMSGCSVEEIAKAMGMSASAVRRAVAQAIDAHRLDRPERYAKLQVARLTKALRSADAWLDKGELRAIEPYLKVVADLDRYHGLRDGPMRPTQPSRLPGTPRAARPPLSPTQAHPDEQPRPEERRRGLRGSKDAPARVAARSAASLEAPASRADQDEAEGTVAPVWQLESRATEVIKA